MAEVIDVTMYNCPMTFVKTKLELQKLKNGDILEVLICEGEPLNNLPESVEARGHKVIEILNLGNGIYKVVIEK